MGRLFIFATGFTLVLQPLAFSRVAFATGGFQCSAEDGNISFYATSALGRGMGAPILNLDAKVTSKLAQTPADLREVDLKDKLVHSWMDDPDLRLHFYMERDGDKPHGGVELIVMATATGDEISYEGSYALKVFFTEPPADGTEAKYLEATGKIACDAE